MAGGVMEMSWISILIVVLAGILGPLCLFYVALVLQRRAQHDPTRHSIWEAGFAAFIGGGLAIMTATAVKIPTVHGEATYAFKDQLSTLDLVLLVLAIFSIGVGIFNLVHPRPLGMLLAGVNLVAVGLWNISIGTWAWLTGAHLYTTVETTMESVMTANPMSTIFFGILFLMVGIRECVNYPGVSFKWHAQRARGFKMPPLSEDMHGAFREDLINFFSEAAKTSFLRWLFLIFGSIFGFLLLFLGIMWMVTLISSK
jgi:hypothetical protein